VALRPNFVNGATAKKFFQSFKSADATILDHLRSPGPHVRGCWAVDRLLAKE
jgi:hypothetical protein